MAYYQRYITREEEPEAPPLPEEAKT